MKQIETRKYYKVETSQLGATIDAAIAAGEELIRIVDVEDEEPQPIPPQ